MKNYPAFKDFSNAFSDPDGPFPLRPDDFPMIPKPPKKDTSGTNPNHSGHFNQPKQSSAATTTKKYTEEVAEEESTKSDNQSTSEKLYMILGCVVGMMMLLLLVFMFMCWYKQRQQRRMMGKLNFIVLLSSLTYL